jgi:EpsI family protein
MPTVGRALVLTLVLVAASAVIGMASECAPHGMRAPLSTLPLTLAAWRGRQEPEPDRATLAALGVDDHLTRSYFGPSVPVGLYVGFWSSQQQGDTIHSPLNCLPGSGWEPVSHRTLQVPVTDGDVGAHAVRINRYVVEKGLDRELILYWYQSHGRVIANEYVGKIYLVSDALRWRRTDAALVRVSVRIAHDDDGAARAEHEGTAFIATLFPALTARLPS